LFKIATQGVSLWQVHVYMYYNLNWFISSIFLLSTLLLVRTCVIYLFAYLYFHCFVPLCLGLSFGSNIILDFWNSILQVTVFQLAI
jgi:hypothetical protein